MKNEDLQCGVNYELGTAVRSKLLLKNLILSICL